MCSQSPLADPKLTSLSFWPHKNVLGAFNRGPREGIVVHSVCLVTLGRKVVPDAVWPYTGGAVLKIKQDKKGNLATILTGLCSLITVNHRSGHRYRTEPIFVSLRSSPLCSGSSIGNAESEQGSKARLQWLPHFPFPHSISGR